MVLVNSFLRLYSHCLCTYCSYHRQFEHCSSYTYPGQSSQFSCNVIHTCRQHSHCSWRQFLYAVFGHSAPAPVDSINLKLQSLLKKKTHCSCTNVLWEAFTLTLQNRSWRQCSDCSWNTISAGSIHAAPAIHVGSIDSAPVIQIVLAVYCSSCNTLLVGTINSALATQLL